MTGLAAEMAATGIEEERPQSNEQNGGGTESDTEVSGGSQGGRSAATSLSGTPVSSGRPRGQQQLGILLLLFSSCLCFFD